ncbi:16S rRNA (cytosine(967)-C(5))-methyltransferase RsmB [Anaerococcus hydrogenalis]|uniref:16S rRNA (cytosine(967)-C(5))-methyltransferase n=1 Tax=Anaerococcus hydrogenalis ACS-025-V-Sch4 TaxID=879306 RepID=F0H270_9FIRM|nr:16S rRNA (cytosine(967)-C(5))-methyltransferase RsmB [Anaerococcus hydrogenalis]EGC83425.1 putative ribosomal RNA small subunit methyltransferase B [Anaerococcus hydrogenalis ACS-025-V-Sch4]
MEDFKLILDGLYRICYKNEKSTDIINNIAREVSDISYITKNIYGVLENKLYLEYIIGKLSKIKIKKLDKKVLLILEIGIYNIHFLDRKNYAIVNELVNLTKKVSYKSKSFVNAILRSYIRDEENLSKIKAKNKEQFQSIKYSIPLWIINNLNESYGYDYTEKFLNSLNKERKLSIRVNKNKIEKNKLKTLLEEKGYEVEESKISSRSLIVKNPRSLADTKEFKEGLFTIQSEASIKVCEVLNPEKNSQILDLCAAPGTKTSFLAELCENSSRIVANDISFNKLSKINENIKRLGLKNIEITNFDASIVKDEYKEKFDYVLCDLPCSGLGVMDRKPEIRYNRTMEDVINLSKLQKNILDRAFLYLKKGGIMVFSTCTIGNIENKDNFTYLSKKKSLKNIKINGEEYLEYNTFEDETDGFFLTKFEKI